MYFFDSVYYVRAMYNGQEVVWPGLVDGEMCHLDRFKDYVVHRYLEHDPAKDCFVPAATAEQRTPDAVGSQF